MGSGEKNCEKIKPSWWKYRSFFSICAHTSECAVRTTGSKKLHILRVEECDELLIYLYVSRVLRIAWRYPSVGKIFFSNQYWIYNHIANTRVKLIQIFCTYLRIFSNSILAKIEGCSKPPKIRIKSLWKIYQEPIYSRKYAGNFCELQPPPLRNSEYISTSELKESSYVQNRKWLFRLEANSVSFSHAEYTNHHTWNDTTSHSS